MPLAYLRASLLPLLLALPLLAGCDQLGIETPAQTQARQDAEGKAIGSACRYSARALEDCYALNKKASKAAIFNGWKEMDAYMRENQIQAVPSDNPGGVKKSDEAASAGEEADKAAEAKEGAKDGAKEGSKDTAKESGAKPKSEGKPPAKAEVPDKLGKKFT